MTDSQLAVAPMHCLTTPGRLAGWQIRKVLGHIQSNLGRRITTREMADLARLGPSHFARAFRATTGSPPGAYIMRCRVARAKEQLQDSNRALAEVALNCGFSDQSHLTRVFRRAVGVNPGEWRRRLLRELSPKDRAPAPQSL